MPTSSPPPDLRARLARYGQEHLLAWWAQLDESRRRQLAADIAQVDFNLLQRLCGEADVRAAVRERAARAQPAPVVRLPQTREDHARWSRAKQAGEECLRRGEVGLIVVAGGQATRLGYDHPKGMFAIGPVSCKSLFQLHCEKLRALSRRYAVPLPYYVMTSDATHDETVAYFEQHAFFGLPPDDVRFFRQGNMPAIDHATGRVLLAEKHRIAFSPDGHGGLLAALRSRSGEALAPCSLPCERGAGGGGASALDDMAARGLRYVYYHQVDNPLLKLCDPAMLGFHVEADAEMSLKVVAKRSPAEKMGVAALVDGRLEVIEYVDLPPELAARTDAAGRPVFWAGSIAEHYFNREFLERLAADLAPARTPASAPPLTKGGPGGVAPARGCSDRSSLPFHRSEKVVPYLDDAGRLVRPAEPNAIKFEHFIFDALPLARAAVAVEGDRAEEFAPVKNAEGDDSPATAREAMCRLHASWLRACGVVVPEGATVEISPLLAFDAEELATKPLPAAVADGLYLR